MWNGLREGKGAAAASGVLEVYNSVLSTPYMPGVRRSTTATWLLQYMLIDSSSGGGRVSGIYASKRYEWDLSLQYTLQHYLWGGKWFWTSKVWTKISFYL